MIEVGGIRCREPSCVPNPTAVAMLSSMTKERQQGISQQMAQQLACTPTPLANQMIQLAGEAIRNDRFAFEQLGKISAAQNHPRRPPPPTESNSSSGFIIIIIACILCISVCLGVTYFFRDDIAQWFGYKDAKDAQVQLFGNSYI